MTGERQPGAKGRPCAHTHSCATCPSESLTSLLTFCRGLSEGEEVDTVPGIFFSSYVVLCGIILMNVVVAVLLDVTSITNVHLCLYSMGFLDLTSHIDAHRCAKTNKNTGVCRVRGARQDGKTEAAWVRS
jgi:hypothetical protein